MQLLGKIFLILEAKATTPESFGWFHILSWIISIAVGIWLCKRFKSPDEKTVRKILFAFAMIGIVLEIYKQTVYSFSYSGGIFDFDYQWYAFPFQFCSTPMYVQLLASLFKKGKIHDALCAFLVSYAVFAGLCVMIYPGDVFTELIGVNIQTMVCHGSMLTVGIFLVGSGYVKVELKTVLKAIPVFASAVGLAIAMNEIMYLSGILGDETFNMFFISRHFAPSLPVYSSVQAIIPFPWCTIIYIAAFSIAAFVILLLDMGLQKLIYKATKKEAA